MERIAGSPLPPQIFVAFDTSIKKRDESVDFDAAGAKRAALLRNQFQAEFALPEISAPLPGNPISRVLQRFAEGGVSRLGRHVVRESFHVADVRRRVTRAANDTLDHLAGLEAMGHTLTNKQVGKRMPRVSSSKN